MPRSSILTHPTMMTDEEKKEQLIKMVYGNVWMEHPGCTMELCRKIVEERWNKEIKENVVENFEPIL